MVEEEKTMEVKEEKPSLNIVEANEGESNEGYHFPWGFMIIAGVIILAIVACIIVIMLTGGPI